LKSITLVIEPSPLQAKVAPNLMTFDQILVPVVFSRASPICQIPNAALEQGRLL